PTLRTTVCIGKGHTMEPVQGFDVQRMPLGLTARELAQDEMILRAAIEQDPTNVQNHLTLGKTYYWHGQIDEAIDSFQRALQIDDRDPAAFYHLGICHFRAARFTQAEKALAKAIALHPRFVMAHYWLGITAYHQGKYEEALGCFETICRESPESMIAHYHAALACMSMGNWALVRQHLEILRENGNTSTRVFLYLGRAYRRMNRPTEAIQVLRKGLSLYPRDELLKEALAELTDVQDP
ncbi:MAG TPA: tetratricopeptide repeat protein, partial [Polyangiaceae bacterium]|nr:tetratricopeptide repeat protein [Polyangiaceae bacterium]